MESIIFYLQILSFNFCYDIVTTCTQLSNRRRKIMKSINKKILFLLVFTFLLYPNEQVEAAGKERLDTYSQIYSSDNYNDDILMFLSDEDIAELSNVVHSDTGASEAQLNNYIMNYLNEKYESYKNFPQMRSNGLTYIKNKLNSVEKSLFKANPTRGITVLNYAEHATLAAKRLYTKTSCVHGNGDAFRHSYWNALMTRRYGSTYAKKWGDAHESGISAGIDKQMDLYNNKIGRELSTTNTAVSHWETKMEKILIKNIDSGKMKIFNSSNTKLVKSNKTGKK